MCYYQKLEKILKVQQGEYIEKYFQILKSQAPPHTSNMHTFSMSNYEFKFLTRSARP